MSEAVPASPAAGQAPAAHHPARGGAAPLPGEPIRTAHRTRDRAHRATHMKATNDLHRAAEVHLPIRAAITTAARRRAETPHLPAEARHLQAEAPLLRAEAARPRDSIKAMSAAAHLNPDQARRAAAHMAQAAPVPHPVPAAAGDTVLPALPADLPAARAKRRKNVVIVSAFSRERSLFFPSRLFRSL